MVKTHAKLTNQFGLKAITRQLLGVTPFSSEMAKLVSAGVGEVPHVFVQFSKLAHESTALS